MLGSRDQQRSKLSLLGVDAKNLESPSPPGGGGAFAQSALRKMSETIFGQERASLVQPVDDGRKAGQHFMFPDAGAI